jgi:hypothetical protein
MRIFGLALLLCLVACAPEGAPNAASQAPTDAKVAPSSEPPVPVRGEPVEPEPQPLGADPGASSGTVPGEPVEPQPQPVDADPVYPSETSDPVEPQSQAASPARRPPEELLTQNEVYYGCNTPADCEVKNVGNCCGYYPACVNKDSPTFPDKVKAACAAEGSSSICGFQEIGGCDCIEGRCTAQPGPGGDLR